MSFQNRSTDDLYASLRTTSGTTLCFGYNYDDFFRRFQIATGRCFESVVSIDYLSDKFHDFLREEAVDNPVAQYYNNFIYYASQKYSQTYMSVDESLVLHMLNRTAGNTARAEMLLASEVGVEPQMIQANNPRSLC